MDTAFPVPPSGTFRTGGIQLLDAGQGFAGFSPMKRTRTQQSTFGLMPSQQQHRSPDENQHPSKSTALSTMSGNKRGRQQPPQQGGGTNGDTIMQCTPLKRGHKSNAMDEELDRPVFSKRYIAQIEQHLQFQKCTYETKLRRDCANEIAAVKAKAARTAADTSSRIALENERLRHENFVR